MVFGASDRAIAMILLHDLVEIDCGDHPIHLAHDMAAVAAAENAAAERLFGLLPDGAALLALWHEFEAGETADARMARRMDHVQPMFQVLCASAPLADHVAIVRDNMTAGRAARLWSEWPEAMAAAQALLDGRQPAGDLAARLAFLAEADRLKTVLRASTLTDASRRENSAEHSWHLALYALVMAPVAGPGVDIGRVIRMLILHDLVEIDTGDVPIHSAGGTAHHGAAQATAEAAAAARIFGLLPAGQGQAFHDLWSEFEANETADAVFAKSLDRAQPVMQNIASGGGTWVEYDVTYVQLVERVGLRIQRGAPMLWTWLDARAQAFFDRAE
jgi:putative hydrolase of HD superfamily